MQNAARHISYWNATAPAGDHPRLTGEIEVDVAIVGGGIVGVTLARALKDRDRATWVRLEQLKRQAQEMTPVAAEQAPREGLPA